MVAEAGTPQGLLVRSLDRLTAAVVRLSHRHRGSAGVDDLALVGHPHRAADTPEEERDAVGLLPVGGVGDLNVQVRFGAVSGVATFGDWLAAVDMLSCGDPYRAVAKVRQEHERTPWANGDHDMVARDRRGACSYSLSLTQHVRQEGQQRTSRGVVRFAVVRMYHPPGERRQDWLAEPAEELWPLRCHQVSPAAGCGVASFIDRYEVHGVRRTKGKGAVTGNSTGRTVLHTPVAAERKVKDHRLR
jgi:hypothetical protein